MKVIYTLITGIILILSTSSIVAQEATINDEGSFLSKLEHQIVAGFNIGASAPTSIPEEIRSIDSYWPQFTPQLGYNVVYRFKDQWGIGSGILLDYKGMGIRAKVKSLHTIVDVKEGDKTGTTEGYFTGKNKTEVKLMRIEN